MMRRACTLLVLVIAFALGQRVAFAGDVDTLITQLKNDSSDKVRLAAAVNLAKLGDAKAILPLATVVLNDSDKNVRAACAVALGNLVTSSTKPAYRNLVIANLKNVAANDASDFVKQQADKALKAITGQGGSTTTTGPNPPPTSGGNGGIYVNVGPMSSKANSPNNSKLQAMMVKVATQTLAKVAHSMSTTWSGGPPSKAVLAQKSVSGFYVDGTLNTLDIKVAGSSSTITCKVSMLLADFPDKNMFGFLNGGASVSASASASDQAMASEDCVQAVIEDLIAKKIIPTICTKTSASCP